MYQMHVINKHKMVFNYSEDKYGTWYMVLYSISTFEKSKGVRELR